MTDRWSRDQILALAPDASAKRAAQTVSSPSKWSDTGFVAGVAVWGECKGSGAKPYRACVDLTEPAYRCSCPSRKFPCKHALGVLLLWSEAAVAPAELPDWVAQWLDQRRERAEKQVAKAAAGTQRDGGVKDTAAAERRTQQREVRVAAGLDELDRWLRDQVRQGLADAQRAPYGHWGELAKRLVDAQAPGVAGVLGELPAMARSGADWPDRLLTEYALLRLLVTAYRRQAELPEPLRHTVRSRVGFPLSREEVLAGTPIRDLWDVLGGRDGERDRLLSRRVWLRGRDSGRMAMVLSYAPAGQALDASLVAGMTIDASLCFYPGSPPLRAVVAERHATVSPQVPGGGSVSSALGAYAAALAEDPWLEFWPVVLEAVLPARDTAGSATRWLADAGGEALPLHPTAGDQWRLTALSGGHPVAVAGEWTPRGLWPLTAWGSDERMVTL